MKRLLYSTAILAFAFTVSCNRIEKTEYLSAEYNSYMFTSGKDSVTIAVNSTSEWEATHSADWIRTEKIAEDSLKIAVITNGSEEPRESEINLLSGNNSFRIIVSQTGYAFKGRFEDIASLADPVISRNGKYVAGVEMGSADGLYVPVIIDTYTGEWTRMEETSDFARIRVISNDGKTMVVIAPDFYTNYIWKDSNLNTIPLPEGYNSPVISNFAYDETIWVGYAYNMNKQFVPVKWTNGEAEILEVPDVNVEGSTLQNGAMARDCNSDGSVIYGSEWDQMGLIYWKDGRMYYPSIDYTELVQIGSDTWVSTIRVTAELSKLSHNGKYLTAPFNDYKNGTTHPVLINTETSEVSILEIGVPAAGLTVNDNGTIFGGLGGSPVQGGLVIDSETGTYKNMSDWMKENYGIVINDDRMITQFSEDNNVIWGMRFQMTGLGAQYPNWYLVLDTTEN